MSRAVIAVVDVVLRFLRLSRTRVKFRTRFESGHRVSCLLHCAIVSFLQVSSQGLQCNKLQRMVRCRGGVRGCFDCPARKAWNYRCRVLQWLLSGILTSRTTRHAKYIPRTTQHERWSEDTPETSIVTVVGGGVVAVFLFFQSWRFTWRVIRNWSQARNRVFPWSLGRDPLLWSMNKVISGKQTALAVATKTPYASDARSCLHVFKRKIENNFRWASACLQFLKIYFFTSCPRPAQHVSTTHFGVATHQWRCAVLDEVW